MKRSDDKAIFKLKGNFPDVEVGLLAVYCFIIGVCIYKYIETSQTYYILLFIGVVVVSVAFGLFFNNSRKTLEITDTKIVVKKWISRQLLQFELKDIKGYDLKENYSRYGLVKHIRLIVSDKLTFEFIGDNYSNYDRLIPALKAAKIQFLGTTELNSKYKHVLSLVTVISGAIALIMFLLVQLLKVLK